MQQWHIETDIVALINVIIMYCEMRMGFNLKRNRDLRFSLCIWICFFATIIDIVSSVVYSVPVSAAFFHLTQTLYHSTNVLVIVSWYHYTVAVIFEDNPLLIRKTDQISLVIYVLYVMFIISNLVTGTVYTYDALSGYARGPLFFVPLGVFAVYSLFVLLFALVFGRRIVERKLQFVLVLVPLLTSFGITIQLSNPGWLTIFPCYAAGLLAAYITIQQSRNDIAFKNLTVSVEHDSLTGICNREHARRLVTEYLSAARAHNCALIMLDVDNFKNINDCFGHAVGDDVLKQVAKYLAGFFRSDDMVARYGGDEFLVFVRDIDDNGLLKNRMTQLVLNLATLRNDMHPNIKITCSAGIAIERPGMIDFETMLQHADAALYSVKNSGKNDFEVYGSDSDEADYQHTRVDAMAQRHTDWFNTNELKRLLRALSEFLPYVASVNITKNSYYVMANRPEMADALPLYGSYDSLIDVSGDVFHPDDCQILRDTFSRARLTELFRSGHASVSCKIRHKSHDGVYRPARVVCLLGSSPGDEEVCAYLLIRPDDQRGIPEL